MICFLILILILLTICMLYINILFDACIWSLIISMNSIWFFMPSLHEILLSIVIFPEVDIFLIGIRVIVIVPIVQCCVIFWSVNYLRWMFGNTHIVPIMINCFFITVKIRIRWFEPFIRFLWIILDNIRFHSGIKSIIPGIH